MLSKISMGKPNDDSEPPWLGGLLYFSSCFTQRQLIRTFCPGVYDLLIGIGALVAARRFPYCVYTFQSARCRHCCERWLHWSHSLVLAVCKKEKETSYINRPCFLAILLAWNLIRERARPFSFFSKGTSISLFSLPVVQIAVVAFMGCFLSCLSPLFCVLLFCRGSPGRTVFDTDELPCINNP